MEMLDTFYPFMVFLFLLNVGKAPANQSEFARIRGEWEVVGVQEMGKPMPAKDWRGKTIVIAAAEPNTVQPAHSLAYWGRLNTHRKRTTLESKFISIASERLQNQKPGSAATDNSVPDYPLPPYPAVVEYGACAIYEVEGNHMRLMLVQAVEHEDRIPTQIVASKDVWNLIFELKRRSRPVAPAQNGAR
jgi:hypothetical protein